MENYDKIERSPTGAIFYTLRGKLHREDGPAIEHDNGSKSWWINGKRHRTDGPAYERIDRHKEWWIDDNKLTEQEFIQQIAKTGDEMKEGPEEPKRYAVICEEACTFYVVDTLSDAILKVEQILFNHDVSKDDILIFHDVPKKVHVKYDFI